MSRVVVPGGKRVFITSATYSGDLKGTTGAVNGLAGGDALCTAAGSAMGGEWKAWLSDSHSNAFDRIDDFSPWYNLSGKLAFPNKASLRSAPAEAILSQKGIPDSAWTGTRSGGGKSTDTCSDWTSDVNGTGGTTGIGGGSQWTELGFGDACNSTNALICFEQ